MKTPTMSLRKRSKVTTAHMGSPSAVLCLGTKAKSNITHKEWDELKLKQGKK